MQQYYVQSAWFFNKFTTLPRNYLREKMDVRLKVIDGDIKSLESEMQRHVLWAGRFSYLNKNNKMRDPHSFMIHYNKVESRVTSAS